MSYKEKYLKYKNKYLKLKNQFGGYLEEGTIVKTIFNNGRMEGMSNQCFWISILQFLNRNGYTNLRLGELRTSVGLDYSTQHTMFDSFNKKFDAAAMRAVQIYNLTIIVYTVTSSGKIIRGAASYENGENIVNIAMFGQQHFQLIVKDDNIEGDIFVPAVNVKNELTKLKDIDVKIQQKYLELNDAINYLNFYKDELKDNNTKMKEHNTLCKIMQDSKSYGDNKTKQTFLKNEQEYYEKIKKQKVLLTKQIKHLEEEIASLQKIIELHEDELIELHEDELI